MSAAATPAAEAGVMAAMPTADFVSKLVTLGPPGLLVLCLVVVLWAAANGKLPIKHALALSGIAATFFVLWFASMEMGRRRVFILTTSQPQELIETYSLRPVRYRLGADADTDLSTRDFEFPNGKDELRIAFDLNGLIRSYENNLKAVIEVAQKDPECFQEATRGVNYSRVAATIKQLCPGSLLSARRPF